MVADQHDLLVEAADVRVAPRAVRIEAPLEHGARYMQRAGNDAVALAVDVCANVDQEGALFGCHKRVHRLEPRDLRSSRLEQLVERSPIRADSHDRIICGPLRPVQPSHLAVQLTRSAYRP